MENEANTLSEYLRTRTITIRGRYKVPTMETPPHSLVKVIRFQKRIGTISFLLEIQVASSLVNVEDSPKKFFLLAGAFGPCGRYELDSIQQVRIEHPHSFV